MQLPRILFALCALGTAELPGQTPEPAAGGGALEDLFKQGSEAYNKGDFATSLARFNDIIKSAKPGPGLETIHYSIAVVKLRQNDHAGAIEAFKVYLQTYPNGSQLNDARIGLTKALVAAKRLPEALAASNSLRNLAALTGVQGIDNYASLLGLNLDIADSLLAEKKFSEALVLLQACPRREQVLVLQRRRIAQLEGLKKQASGSVFGSSNAASLGSRLDDAKLALKQVDDTPTFDLPRLLRLGQCFMEMEQPWEATVVYRDLLSRFATSPDRAYALRGLIFARHTTGHAAEAVDLAEQFLKDFPDSPLANDIGVLAGQLALHAQQHERGVSLFGQVMEKTKGDQRERVLFLLGGAHFEQNRWAQAREQFERFLKEFPKSEQADNVAYRSALSWMLDLNDLERYAKGEKAIQAYVKTTAESPYQADAFYRLAICQFAFQEYPKAIAACEAWETRFPSDGLLPQVLSLKGDVQKELGKTDEAIDTYLRAASAASSDEVLTYALNEAARLLEQKKDWARLTALFSAQIASQPSSKLAMGWYYWVARAEARAGRSTEAWAYLADRVGQEMQNANKEDVEKILDLMAQIRAREKAPADGVPAPSAQEQFLARLKLQGTPPPLTSARLRYYQAKVLAGSRKPEEAAQLMLGLGREMPPEQMSAALLALAGDSLWQNAETERAKAFFEALLTRFPDSEYRDYAYVGLGNLALADNAPDVALGHFNNAIKKAGAVHCLREATVGQARSQLGLGLHEQATKLFETIAATKQWRGEATALSLYYLGEIAGQQGDLPKAIAFYQRVFVSQVRYTEWVAKSYVASGQAFEKLGKTPEAIATYREMLRNERISARPELKLARERLNVLVPPATS